MIEALARYRAIGVDCLPCQKNKSPHLPAGYSWKQTVDEQYYSGAYGIGLKGGLVSGGLVCLDFDNHFGDAKENLNNYIQIPEVNEIYNRYKIPIERTQNGGYHVIYKHPNPYGCEKLASRAKADGKPDAIIETKGEGGYFVAAPTPGYDVVRNDIFNIPLITDVEAAVLIDYAVSLNEFAKEIVKHKEYEGGDRPGDKYNESVEGVDEMKSALSNAGWKQIGGKYWRRPGKDDGISGTLGHVGENIFYCFTANGYPFEEKKCYTPFQVKALLENNGDFKKTAEELAEKYAPKSPGKTAESELMQMLNSVRINTDKVIERPPTILSIRENYGTSTREKRLFTLGNFSSIIGKPKTKKTFLSTLMTAAVLGHQDGRFISELPENKSKVLYFDTEQGEYDSYATIKRIEKLSGVRDRLMAFHLRKFDPRDRCQLIEQAFKVYGENVGYCVIDGIADLALAVNDEEEASKIATMLLRITEVHQCHISIVIHQNKENNFAIGWLGGAITKKSELIISAYKIENEPDSAQIKCELSRAMDFKDFKLTIDDDGLPYAEDLEPKKKQSISYFNDTGKNETEEYTPF